MKLLVIELYNFVYAKSLSIQLTWFFLRFFFFNVMEQSVITNRAVRLSFFCFCFFRLEKLHLVINQGKT